jgi:hypothetical protein
MEPTDLNSSANPNDDAGLAAMLRHATNDLPDEVFTTRVLAALPPAKAGPAPGLRIKLCLAGTIAGCAVVLWSGISWPGVQSDAERFAVAFGTTTISHLIDPWFVSAITMATVSLLFAFYAELRGKLLS